MIPSHRKRSFRGRIHDDTLKQRDVEILDSSGGIDKDTSKPRLQELALLPCVLRRPSLLCSSLISSSSSSCSPCSSSSFLPSLSLEHRRLFFSLRFSYFSRMCPLVFSSLRKLFIQGTSSQRRKDGPFLDRCLLSQSVQLSIISSLSSFSSLSPSLSSRSHGSRDDEERVSSMDMASPLLSLSSSSPSLQAIRERDPLRNRLHSDTFPCYGSSYKALHLSLLAFPIHRDVRPFFCFSPPCLSFFDRSIYQQSSSSFSFQSCYAPKCFFSSSALARMKDVVHKRDQTSLFSSSSSSLSAQRVRESHHREVKTDVSSSDIVTSSLQGIGVYGAKEDDRGRRKEEDEREEGEGTIELQGPVALSRTILKAFRYNHRFLLNIDTSLVIRVDTYIYTHARPRYLSLSSHGR